MKNRYGSKFSMTWINTSEISEFDVLFGHAQNLGLNTVWIYSLDSHQYDQFEYISNAAYYHGFLRRFLRKWREKYRCNCRNGCKTIPPGEGCWEYQGKISTNTVIEG